MGKLDQQIRSKRFSVRSESNLFLTVDFNNGDQIKFKISDCSLTGIRGISDIELSTEKLPDQGSIVTASKLTWGQSEYALGRLVFRRVFPTKSGIDFAFATVNIKIPFSSAISKLLDTKFHMLDDGKSEELSSDNFSLAHFVESEYLNVDLFDRMRKFDTLGLEFLLAKKCR